MQFKINKQFAQKFNEYRQKEEYEKLKARHGDRSFSEKSTLLNQNLNTFSNGELSTSSSDSDSNSSWVDREQEDFLNIYKALCTNDPSIDDPNKQWFRDPDQLNDLNGDFDNDQHENNGAVQTNSNCSKIKTVKQLKLKDYHREFLFHEGIEDDAKLEDIERLAKLESDDILEQMKSSIEVTQKDEFLK